jgi:methionine-rich copper-binding protein CopC
MSTVTAAIRPSTPAATPSRGSDVAGLMAGAVFAAAALAHADLLGIKPRAGATLERAPQVFVLTFDEAIEIDFVQLDVRDASGGRADRGEPYHPGGSEERVAVRLRRDLAVLGKVGLLLVLLGWAPTTSAARCRACGGSPTAARSPPAPPPSCAERWRSRWPSCLRCWASRPFWWPPIRRPADKRGSAADLVEPVVAEGGQRVEIELPAAQRPPSGDGTDRLSLVIQRARDDRDSLARDPAA